MAMRRKKTFPKKKERSRAEAENSVARERSEGLFALLRGGDGFGDAFFATLLICRAAATFDFFVVLFAHSSIDVLRIEKRMSSRPEKETDFRETDNLKFRRRAGTLAFLRTE